MDDPTSRTRAASTINPNRVRFSVPVTHFKTRHSPLSPDNPSTPSFEGLVNLAILLFVAGDARLLLENLDRYGLTIQQNLLPSTTDLVLTLIALTIPIINALLVYMHELHVSKHADNKHNKVYQALNACCSILAPCGIAYAWIQDPGMCGAIVLLSSCMLLKMWSFAATNAALRQAYLNKEPTPYTLTEGSPPYPSNITPGNVLYFWAVPTFCYQPSYPRTDTIRWSVVLSLVIRMVASALLLVFIVLQYSLPTMAHSLNAFGPHGEIYPLVFLERVLKLSASAVPAFLCMFYLVFHCHLNLLAELTRFADRSFYRPWWNSNTLGDAWRDWNTPVHDFCKRHIYIPLRAHYGVSPLVGQIIVFGFSAVMHEFMVAVPSKSFTGQATVGFLLQVPLIAGTEVMKSRRGGKGGWEGNVVVWLVFIVVGWPGLALIYYRGWTQSHL